MKFQKKLSNLISFILIFNFQIIFAQNNSYLVSISSDLNFTFSSNDDVNFYKPHKYSFKDNYGFGGNIFYNRQISKTLSVDLGIGFSSQRYFFETNCFCFIFADRISVLNNYVKSNFLSIPIRLKTDFYKNERFKLFIKIGAVGNGSLKSSRYIEKETTILSSNQNSYEFISEDKFNLKTKFNNYLGCDFSFGIGSEFKIKNRFYQLNISYLKNLINWKYELNYNSNYIYVIKNRTLRIEFAALLNGK